MIYVKATLSGDEPLDVINYGKAHPAFPHESTADQWFSESQFESYRALAFHSLREITGGDGPLTFAQSRDRVQQLVDPPSPAAAAPAPSLHVASVLPTNVVESV